MSPQCTVWVMPFAVIIVRLMDLPLPTLSAKRSKHSQKGTLNEVPFPTITLKKALLLYDFSLQQAVLGADAVEIDARRNLAAIPNKFGSIGAIYSLMMYLCA